MPLYTFLVFLLLTGDFPCSHSSEGSFSDATHELVGESKMTPPPSQTVATSRGAPPNPSRQEARVIVPQTTAPGPSESPSEHVSFFSLATGGALEPYFRMIC